MKFFLILLFLPFCASAGDLYNIHRLSEQEILKTYAELLRDACHHADKDWTNSTFDPSAGYWGDGASSGNEGLRTVASMVLACSTLLKYDNHLSAGERQHLFDKATDAIRFSIATHVTGMQKCPDGKHWGATPKFGGESWQSGMWTGTLVFGAWLIWDKLDPSLQQGVERVAGWEDDILAKRPPPNGLWLDTKAEENGWEVPCQVLGELMFPANPHAAAWHKSARDYMMNTLCTEEDTHNTNLVDGRAVNAWVKGANVQPDFTLENHNFFHPSYVGCSSYFLTQAAIYYTYAGRPIPQAAAHHLLDTWRMFRTILLPWGESAYPQGMDWELHCLPFINLYATLATRDQDPFAARLEQNNLQYMRAWQEMRHGGLDFPGSRLGITRTAINAEQASYGFLAHKIFGPAAKGLTAGEANAREQGVWDYSCVDFIEHRTDKKFISFSWKNRVMGEVIPIGEGHEGNPDFTVPIVNAMVGSFDLVPRDNVKPTVVGHSRRTTPDGFETIGTLLLNGGRLRQSLRVTSIGSQTVVYEDRVTAVSNVTVRSERGMALGIENDEITGGRRVVADQEGKFVFDWKKPHTSVLPGSWANIDGRLGVVMLAGAGMSYAQGSGYLPGISVCADTLYGSYSDNRKQFKAGEEVAHRLAVVFVEVTAKETSELAKSCKLEAKPDGRVLRFKQPGGRGAEVPLL